MTAVSRHEGLARLKSMRMARRAWGVLARSLSRRRRLALAIERRFVTSQTPIILDVGGNKGQSARRYRRMFPTATVHSFEPLPETYEKLRRTASRLQKVATHQVALADSPGNREFHVSPDFGETNSLLQRPQTGRRYYPRGAELTQTTTVEVTTVDIFCATRGIEAIDLMKIDVQGGELLVLRGAQGLLASHAIGAILCELAFTPHYEQGVLYHDLARFLESFGYTIFDFDRVTRARNGQLRYCDGLFVSDRLRRALVDRMPEEP